MPRWPHSPLTDEERELAGAYLPQTRIYAAWASRVHPSLRDEIESECVWMLCLTAARYRPRLLPFGAYLDNRLRAAVQTVVRREARTVPAIDPAVFRTLPW